MMIVTPTMGYDHHRIYTTRSTQKRAGAFTLALFMPLYFGRVSPRYACAAEAWADHDGPPFRLFPDGWEVYLRRVDYACQAGSLSRISSEGDGCVFRPLARWRGTSPPLGGPGPYGQPVQEPQIRDRAQSAPYVRVPGTVSTTGGSAEWFYAAFTLCSVSAATGPCSPHVFIHRVRLSGRRLPSFF